MLASAPQHLNGPALPTSLAQLEADMHRCEQSSGLSVYQHGLAVKNTFAELLDLLQHPTERGDPSHWRFPAWLVGDARQQFLRRLAPLELLETYHLYHDCGKPYCLTVDDQGRRHFPGHAQHSEQVWLGLGGDARVARLMGQDMDVHLLSADEVPSFAAREDAASLWLTGLAEVHANAAMFGGTQSTSFKAKAKHLDRRGKALVACWAAT